MRLAAPDGGRAIIDGLRYREPVLDFIGPGTDQLPRGPDFRLTTTQKGINRGELIDCALGGDATGCVLNLRREQLPPDLYAFGLQAQVDVAGVAGGKMI